MSGQINSVSLPPGPSSGQSFNVGETDPSLTAKAWDNFVKRAEQEVVFTVEDGNNTYSLEKGVLYLDKHQSGKQREIIPLSSSQLGHIKPLLEKTIELAAAYLVTKQISKLENQLLSETNPQIISGIRNKISLYQSILESTNFPANTIVLFANSASWRNPESRLARALNLTFPGNMLYGQNLIIGGDGQVDSIYLSVRQQIPPVVIDSQPAIIQSEQAIPASISEERIKQLLDDCAIDVNDAYWAIDLNYQELIDAETDEVIGYYQPFGGAHFFGLDMEQYATAKYLFDVQYVNLGTFQNPDLMGIFDNETLEWNDDDGNLIAYVDSSVKYYYDREEGEMIGFSEQFLAEYSPNAADPGIADFVAIRMRCEGEEATEELPDIEPEEFIPEEEY